MIKKEHNVLEAMEEDAAWNAMKKRSLKNAWDKEDDVWDNIYKKTCKKNIDD